MYKKIKGAKIMEENHESTLIPDPNEIHINVKKKDTGDNLFDSDCCSVMTLVLTADGRLATSYFGLHTPEVIKAMKRITNQYYAKLNKEFKIQYKQEKARIKGIKVLKEKNPELTDEALLKLANELRELQRREEENQAIEMEKNKTEANRPAVVPTKKSTSTVKKTAASSKTTKKSTIKKSTTKSSNKTNKK